MSRPLIETDRQRPAKIHLRDRPRWQELLPHLLQLGIEIVFHDELPRFDEAAVEWMQQTEGKSQPTVNEIKTLLRKPFTARKQTRFTEAMDLMEWTDAMSKRAYPSRNNPVPPYDSTTIVSLRLTAKELETVLTTTEIVKTKKLRPRLEAMAAEGRDVELDIPEWSRVLLHCVGARRETCPHRRTRSRLPGALPTSWPRR
jgi:hypothetical protein